MALARRSKRFLDGNKKTRFYSFGMRESRGEMIMDQDSKILLIGALAGAATGIVAAMMLQRRARQTGTELSLTAGEGVQLGMLVLGLVRAVVALADKDPNQ
jgi:hypothetical protein